MRLPGWILPSLRVLLKFGVHWSCLEVLKLLQKLLVVELLAWLEVGLKV